MHDSRMLSHLSYGLGVCLSVCLFVTLLYFAKTVPTRITKSLLLAAPRSLVYCDKSSCPCMRGFLLNEGIKEG